MLEISVKLIKIITQTSSPIPLPRYICQVLDDGMMIDEFLL